MTESVRVLVVDDDFRVGGLHREVVSSRPGFRVLAEARTVAQARRVLADDGADLLLADVYLPDGDGIGLVAASGIDAFVLSAASDATTVRRALAAGALGYLVKPFTSRVLASRLDAYARYRNLLEGERTLDQETIDRAQAILHTTVESASASRSATEQMMLAALGDDEASAAEVSERTGVSRATAQRHLANLASREIIDVRLRYGSTGRPEHRYAVRS